MDILRLISSIKDIKSFNLWQSLFAEFLGTFLLAFIGFGSVFSNMNPVKVGLGFGLAGVVIIYCIGPISGGNINPAVSFGLLIARQISLIRCILYFFVQTIGATFGYKFILILTNDKVLNKSFLTMNLNKNISNIIKKLYNESFVTMQLDKNVSNIIKKLYSESFVTMQLNKNISDIIKKLYSESFVTMQLNKNISDTIKKLYNESFVTMNANKNILDIIKKLYNESFVTMNANKNISNTIKTLINKIYIDDSFIITEKIDRIDGVYLRIFCEMVISFVLVFTVMRLCVEKSRSTTEKGLAPLIIGISITIGVYCGMNISGGSMNPAVSLGKYIWTGSTSIKSHIVGPLIGGFFAGILQQLVFSSNLSFDHIKSYLFSSEFDNDESSNNERQNDIQLNDTSKTGRYSPNIEHVQKSQQY